MLHIVEDGKYSATKKSLFHALIAALLDLLLDLLVFFWV